MQLSAPETQGFSSKRLANVNRVMQGYIDREELAGMITLVARRGEVIHLEKLGWMDREAGKSMEFDAIFRIHSMTKPITAAAAMMLFEEGHFHLTDPISRYLPAFKEMKVYQPRGTTDFDFVPAKREITIHDLLTHTAGLSYGFDEKFVVDSLYNKNLWARINSEPGFNLERAIEAVAELPLAGQPGETFRYSFANDVIGRLVEVISGQTLDAFFKARIFEPLDMPDTDFYIPAEKHARLTAVYGPAETGGLKVVESPLDSRYKKPPKMLSGGGGLVSTMADYLRFAQMMLNRGELDGQRLLGRKTVELMLLNHLPADGRNPREPFSGYGLGGSVMRDVALSQMLGSIGEWGWSGAANTWFWIDPLENITGIIMTQFLPPFLLPVMQDFKNMVYQALVD